MKGVSDRGGGYSEGDVVKGGGIMVRGNIMRGDI